MQKYHCMYCFINGKNIYFFFLNFTNCTFIFTWVRQWNQYFCFYQGGFSTQVPVLVCKHRTQILLPPLSVTFPKFSHVNIFCCSTGLTPNLKQWQRFQEGFVYVPFPSAALLIQNLLKASSHNTAGAILFRAMNTAVHSTLAAATFH